MNIIYGRLDAIILRLIFKDNIYEHATQDGNIINALYKFSKVTLVAIAFFTNNPHNKYINVEIHIGIIGLVYLLSMFAL